MTSRDALTLCRHHSRWAFIAATIGVGCGLASAIFLLVLDLVTGIREHHPWLLVLLPVGGALAGLSYHYFGRSVEGGNNLIIDQFHDPQSVIPFRMAPLVLLGTLVTHLFGGSAGREGTAVQMGGSIADQLTHLLKVNRSDRRTLLMAGMAGGFGSVFGVPFAGTLFGIEVLAVGRLHLWAFAECAISAYVAHRTTLALGVHHTSYGAPEIPELSFITGTLTILAGIAFGCAARLFAFVSDTISAFSRKRIGFLPLRTGMGGALISALYFVAPGLTRYAGLGVSTMVVSQKWPVPLYDWIGKLLLTALTLGVGFKGGEVTPLLFIGSTLGNALAQFLPISLPLLSCLGFVAVFAGAANTPFACTVMAMELFGPNICVFAALACFASYAVSGHHGIYHAQRVQGPKDAYATRTVDFLRYLFHRPPLEDDGKK